MLTKKLISIAAVAILSAIAFSETASARPGGHGFRGHIGFHGGHYGRHWGHRYGWGVYGAPLYVSTGAYALDCYYVRRRGVLYRVCN